MADVLPAGIQPQSFLAAPPSLSVMSYNISLNFSSILAKLPGSRFLARLRKGVYQSSIDTPHPAASVVEEWITESSLDVVLDVDVDTTPPVEAAVDSFVFIPGPWAFFISGYMLGLLLMTIVLHRMRNVIIPSRIPARRRRQAFPFPAPISPFEYPYISRRMFSSILPLDFSRTTTRLALHLPSIYFLCRMLLLWCLLVLQTCELLPSFSEDQKSAYWGILDYVERLGVWSSQKEMGDICWTTFCTVCAALLVEGLVKALDGIGSALPIVNVTSNTSPFNLVGYAFLLHAYSFPIAHSQKSTEDSPSRPDKHAIITIAIPLFQLTVFHILSVSKRHSRHRLIPTALTSFLSLAHFHGTLYHHLFGSSSDSPTGPAISLARLKSTPYLGGSRFTYPLLNYVPNIFETVLIGTILLTISLNALVQLLARGRVDRIFSGLGVRSGVNSQEDETTTLGFFQQLPYEEDFGILLLRVGTASLEATGLRGWNNEVAPIPLPSKSITRKRARGNYSRGPAQTHGVVRMGRMGVAEIQYGSRVYPSTSTSRVESSSSNPLNPYEEISIRRRWLAGPGEMRQPKQRQQRGLFNEVRTVEVGVSNTSGPPRGITGWWRRIKQIWPFLVALWEVLKGLVFFLWDKARSRGRSQLGDRVEKASITIRTSTEGHWQDDQSVEDDGDDADDTRRMDREREVYSRFLRDEEISDDEHEDDDFTSSFGDEDSRRSIEDVNEEEEEEEEEGEEDGQGEAVQLFTDFLRNGRGSPTTSVGAGGGEMVLAHLFHGQATSSGPLTRRGWRELVEKRGVGGARDYRSNFRPDEDDVDDDDIWNQPSSSFSGSEAPPADSQQLFTTTCVICTNERRNIICWPCRCLAMCDNCREALSSRSAPSKHCCPCCRRTVEGYSRIYIP
ncbi:hypothetical protein BYT27DRAFT_7114356 [Phlegmacium glaucopus]|nr:hypothetical protein BYT27DRAFT_7114356 [Phlegmacium glaucopus]